MKWKLFLTLILLACSPHNAYAQEPEEISDFHSAIVINTDGSLAITETIHYTTTLTKHGIYRYIPEDYTKDGRHYTARIKVNSVTADSENEPYQLSRSSGNLVLKIGSKDVTFTGPRTYTISYTVDNVINNNELSWDIVGEGWTIPIASVSAGIMAPAPVRAAHCYAGEVGLDDGRCQTTSQNTQTNLVYPHTIDYGQNVSVLLILPPDTIRPLTGMAAWIKWLSDNWPAAATITPLIFWLWYYFRYGRDYEFISPDIFTINAKSPQHLKPLFGGNRTPFVYEPLHLTPGEAGIVLDESVDNQDVIAEIVELAHLKYLSISADYTFTQLKKSDTKIAPHQKYLLDHIFTTGPTVKLSSLKGAFYPHFEKTKELLAQSVTDKQLFTTNPRHTRGLGLVLTGLSLGVGFFILATTNYLTYVPTSVLILCITAPFTLMLGYHLPRRTAKGTNYFLQARGLRQTIRWGKWREEIKEKHLFIEEILPFAVSLGVIDKLAKDMKALNLEPPKYASSFTANNMMFAHNFTSFSNTMNQSLTHNPSSSSWSGGSGFSGGGGGGGGGGSW